MTTSQVIDLAHLRRGCSQCSLRQLCLPAGIDPAELARLDQIVRRRRPLQPGERLFRPGDPLRAIFVARLGAFKTISTTEDGEEQIVGFHLPGELMGLDGLGSGSHRCEAVALAPATVCEVPFDELVAVSALLPSLQQQLLRVIGQSVDRDQDHMAMLGKRQANERIAAFLHGLGERLHHIGQSRTDLRLPMSREDIARFLGLALETVSRGFGRLQEDGVIAVHGRQVEVLDLREFLRLAHGTGSPPTRARARGQCPATAD